MSDPAHGEARPRVRCDRCMFWSFELRQPRQDEPGRITTSTCTQDRSPFAGRVTMAWNACRDWQRGEPRDMPVTAPTADAAVSA